MCASFRFHSHRNYTTMTAMAKIQHHRICVCVLFRMIMLCRVVTNSVCFVHRLSRFFKCYLYTYYVWTTGVIWVHICVYAQKKQCRGWGCIFLFSYHCYLSLLLRLNTDTLTHNWKRELSTFATLSLRFACLLAKLTKACIANPCNAPCSKLHVICICTYIFNNNNDAFCKPI